MSLTRKMLKAFGIEDTIIEQIIEAHTETTDSLKAERDRYKDEASKVPELEKKLGEAESDSSLEELQAKYDEAAKELAKAEKAKADIQGEYDKYRAEVTERETKGAKERAYRKLLADENVNPKYVDVVVRATDLSKTELDDDGNFKDGDKLAESVRKDWGEFVMKQKTKGAEPETPPKPGKTKEGANELAVQIAKERHERLYGKSEE